MNDYELTCLISSALEEQEKNKITEEIKSLITSSEGEIVNLSPLSQVNLGYPIKNESKAHMLIIDFKISKEKIEELKNSLNDKKELLRFFLIKRRKQIRIIHRRQTRTIPERKTGTVPIETVPKRQTGTVPKIKLKDIDKKIEEILSPSGKISEEETKEPEGNKQNDEPK